MPQKDFLAERCLPSGTSITQVYETARRELLIVGEAGAGKSTLLLMLGQYLVDKAKQDNTHPIPFILSLSTWARAFPNPDKGYLAESSKMTSRRGLLPRLEGQHDDALSS